MSSRRSEAASCTRIAIRSGPVPRDDLGRRQRLVTLLGRGEGTGQFGLQPVKAFLLGPFLVAPDQVADIFADVLIRPVLADIGRNEIAERAAETDGHGRGAGHGGSCGLAYSI